MARLPFGSFSVPFGVWAWVWFFSLSFFVWGVVVVGGGEDLYLDAMGIPLVTLGNHDLKELKKIDTYGDPALIQEKRMLIVEHFLLIGIKSQTLIATELGVNRTTVRRCIKQIEFRWSINRRSETNTVRGESLSNLDLISRELWTMFESPKTTDTAKLTIIGRLIQIHDRRLTIYGFTPHYLKNHYENSPQSANIDGYESVNEKIRRHKRTLELSYKLLDYLK